jgi:hypothetical protein
MRSENCSGDMFPRKTHVMHKAAAMAAMILLLTGAAADLHGAPVTGALPAGDQADWHGRGHGGDGRGHGGDDGSGAAGGNVIIGLPGPSGPNAPYPPGPYPGSSPLPPGGSTAGAGSPSWPVWYYCDQPGGYYPYVKLCTHGWQKLPVMPPPPGSGSPVAETVWEHCDAPEGYFPYVAQCRHPWQAITASIPVPGDYPDGIPAIAQWFYCEDAKDYLPYAGSCPHVWRSIPAVPPPNVQSATRK